ncbi:sensor histidine kinase KdpD [Asticcacaulis sp. AC402]|uniref:sensor histidine kinase n=1 Tax=Asticcacaulis sp. AC402 TaxID=1282361 RepID=UPI0003C402CC|nr:HAMP domain-containing sensor histidine kinase [Asticcacaulis sp. AC402]ESQ74058.1 hypothetical protein ABAC402_16300 [Asticcacaulis sp. AC402]
MSFEPRGRSSEISAQDKGAVTAAEIGSNGFCASADIVRCGLVAERQESALREQFIAVLGHDLRNPLSAIISGMQLMSKGQMDAQQATVAKLVSTSADRMSGLIDDIMDFARGRLGDGMTLARNFVQLDPFLTQVIDELRSTWPTRTIKAEVSLLDAVYCDPGRLSQMLSNLLANALIHGATEGPVFIRAFCQNGVFELSVSNTGDPIATADIARLFQPFTRDEVRPCRSGLGLGLYIASEIARAHGGQLHATSTADETRFTFRMPV